MAGLFGAALRGNLTGYMRADAEALARVHTKTVRAAGGRTRRGIQKQIDRALDGEKFKNAIRFKSDPPRGFSTKTTVRVYSKAKYGPSAGRRTSAVDLLDLYSRSETVTARSKQWLARPTENAPWRDGRGGKRKAQPSEAGLDLVFLAGPRPDIAYLVTRVRGNARPVLMYVLFRRTQRRARLDPDKVHAASLARVSADMKRFWLREDAAMRRRFGAGISVEGR